MSTGYSRIFVDETNLYTTQKTTLDGVEYLLGFTFNSREQAYYLTIQSSDGSITYAQGVKIVSNFFLLRTFATPPGELLAVAPDADDSPARVGDLGENGRVSLYYIDAATIYAGGIDPQRNPGPLGV